MNKTSVFVFTNQICYPFPQELGVSDDHSLARDLSGSSIWDVSDDWEQVEALKAAAECSFEIGLSKVCF